LPVLYLLSVFPQTREAIAFARFSSGLEGFPLRSLAIFVPLLGLDEEDRIVIEPAIVAMRIAGLVFLVVLLYLAGRAMTSSLGPLRAAMLAAGSVMLAGGLADAVGLAVTIHRSWYVGGYDDIGTAAAAPLWTSDGLYAGFWLGVIVFMVLWPVLAIRRRGSGHMIRTKSSDRADGAQVAPDLCVGDFKGLAARIATFVSLPLLAIVLFGGRDQFTYIVQAYSSPEGDTWFSALGRQVLFNFELRPTPPVVLRDPADLLDLPPDLDLLDVWLVPAVNSLVMVAVVGLVLYTVVGRLSLTSTVSKPGLVVAGWGLTVLAGSLAGMVHAVNEAFLSRFPSLFMLSLEFPGGVVQAMRFTSLWGWLVGVLLLVAHQYAAGRPERAP